VEVEKKWKGKSLPLNMIVKVSITPVDFAQERIKYEGFSHLCDVTALPDEGAKVFFFFFSFHFSFAFNTK